MSSFTEPLELGKISKNYWRTAREFSYYLHLPDGDQITVPKGYSTDGASIPKMFWFLFPPNGKYAQAAVVHDWIYEHGGFTEIGVLTRKQADQIFLEGMKVLGVPWWKRCLFYWAVRLAPTKFHVNRFSLNKHVRVIATGEVGEIIGIEEWTEKQRIVKLRGLTKRYDCSILELEQHIPLK